MKYLIDTHVFIWALTATRRLPKGITAILSSTDNDIFISAVTFWEIAIKIRSGRLEALGRGYDAVANAEELGFKPIPLLSDEAANSSCIKEGTHFDPFDRMLIWQAIERDLTLISQDSEFKKFEADGLKLLWK